MHFKCHFCWAIRVWREWPLHSAQIVLRRSPPPCIYYCLVWWSVGGTMQFHHLWEGSFWLRHMIQARWCKLFATEMLWEKRGILFIEMHCTWVPFSTHMHKCGLGVSLSEEQRKKGTKSPSQSVAFCPSPCFPVSSVVMGHAVYMRIGTTSPYSSLLLDSTTSPTSSRECSTPSILSCIHPFESCLRYFFYLHQE